MRARHFSLQGLYLARRRAQAVLNRAAWRLGKWIAAGALEQADVEDQLYAAAALNGLVADDGRQQTWATIQIDLDI